MNSLPRMRCWPSDAARGRLSGRLAPAVPASAAEYIRRFFGEPIPASAGCADGKTHANQSEIFPSIPGLRHLDPQDCVGLSLSSMSFPALKTRGLRDGRKRPGLKRFRLRQVLIPNQRNCRSPPNGIPRTARLRTSRRACHQGGCPSAKGHWIHRVYCGDGLVAVFIQRRRPIANIICSNRIRRRL